MLQQFSTDKRKAIRAYQDFVREGKDWGRRPELVGGGLVRSLGGWSNVSSLQRKKGEVAHDPRILGSGDFVQTMVQEAEEKIARRIRHQAGNGSAAIVIRQMCQEGGLKQAELLGGGRRRKVPEVRAKIAYCLNREMRFSLAEIGRHLGVGTSAVAMAIRKKERTGEK